jgi:hypothetical protein
MIGSSIANAGISLMQYDGLQKYEGIEAGKKEEAFEQDCLALASMEMASDLMLNSNAGICKMLQEALVGGRLVREVSI